MIQLKISNQQDNAGHTFYQNECGNIDLWTLPIKIFQKIGRQNAPIRLTQYNVQHIIDNHYKEFAENEQSVFDFVDAIFANYTNVRQNGRSLFVTIEDKIGKAAIIRLFPSLYGDYYNVDTAGYYRGVFLSNKELIWSESEPHFKVAETLDTRTGLSHKSAGNAINAVSQTTSENKDTTNFSKSKKMCQK
ncbi:hypothetical protein AGMMS4956_19000 [Bacteroidia bacterium]|nr:hypothetical protein AGMMS4956_19000 [Bacteroidia bacterium]